MAQDIHFGRLKCYEEDDYHASAYTEDNPCGDIEEEEE